MNRDISSLGKKVRVLMPRNHLRASFLTAILLLAGCQPGANLPMLSQPAVANYRLGAGDEIRVITFDESQLTNTFTVGADGNISFPLIGNVQAAGLTVTQLSDDIAQSLKQGQIISQPSVSVQVAEYRPISVLGEVNRPGQYPYQPGMTMLDAVALAGGFTYRAITDYGSDWRPAGQNSGAGATQGKINPGSTLAPGDVITIYERYF